MLDAQARRRGERLALIAPSMVSGSEQRLDYAALRERSVQVAAALAAAGVVKGDRVGIMLGNDAALEAHLVYHASHWLGAVNVPVNDRYVARELRYVLDFIRPKVLVFAGAFAPTLAGLGDALEGVVLLEVAATPALGASFAAAVAAAAGVTPPPAPLEEYDDADWIFTSGTTGNPKAVGLPHAQSVACGHQAIPLWGLEADSVYQSFAPFFTSTGCHTNLLACLVAGCTYAIEPAFDVDGTLERMRRYGTTSIFLINSVLALIFKRRGEQALTDGDFPALRRICWGGQAASPEFGRRLYRVAQAMGIELTNVYGLTESGNAGIMLIPSDHAEAVQRAGPEGVSIGRTPFHPWVEHAVLRPDGTPVDVDELGELCLRGPSTMPGYVRDPHGSAAVLRHGWLYTGDVCRVDDAGFVYFVDRSKQMIRRSGLNISSAEVEGVLTDHPGIAEAAAVPAPNPVLGEDVRAVVVAAIDPPPSPDAVIAFCRERLADYKVPSTVEFVAALPRNGMGRVIKGALTGQAGLLGAEPDRHRTSPQSPPPREA
ncbi:MAG TPA: AMP-binding protein [Solirubrobacteraceae bacterium]|nr:AMP-binding protein [Solirubrobacteraceae bacterium]